MADDDLRRLERRWRETQEPADEGRYLLARLRAGELSRRALELSALLGQPGAAAALPELAASARGRERARELAGGWPEAGWRLLLAECERVLTLFRADPPPDTGCLVVVEGPRTGSELWLAARRPLQLDRSGAPADPPAAVVSFRSGSPAQWSMTGRAEGVTLNGERVSAPRSLQHGDWLTLGDACLVFSAGEGPLRADEVGLTRAWLDELWGRTRGAEALELAPLWLEEGRARSWLRGELTRLDAALCAQAPVSLEEWPAPFGEPVERAPDGGGVAEWALGREPSPRLRARRALERLEVASPCPLSWEQLRPRPEDPRLRDCAQCERAVYDLRELSAAEAAELVTRDDRVCVRLYRRPDGGVMTRDCASSFPREAPDDLFTLGMLA